MVRVDGAAMLLGEYEHTIDDKNRLTLPAKFRESFANGVVLVRGVDRCVEVYAREEWRERVAERLLELDPLDTDTRSLRRLFFASASDGDVDKQGRIMIPAALGDRAGLKREVVIAGVYDHLEVWDRAAWRQQLEDVEGSAQDVADRLASQRD